MNRKTKFLWCPVCMVHTYHAKGERGWCCLNEDHEKFLQMRSDPWIEKYRTEHGVLTPTLEKGER
ncbi:MAG: hypothetical protein R6U57_08000 [Anaerolineales bacterium]